MRTLRNIALSAAAALALAGCGENRFANGEVVVVGDPDIFDAVRLEVDDGSGFPRDLIDEGGRFELILEEGTQAFRSDLELRGVDLEVSGTFRIDDGRITFSDGPFEDDTLVLERSYDVLLGDAVMLLENVNGVFDLDNDGTREVVELEVLLERRD